MANEERTDSHHIEKFQVVIRIIEVRSLIGLDIDPCIEVTVGEYKKLTKTKKSCNAATYDEDFLFDFSLTETVFKQQIITIEALSDSRLFRRSATIGCFKIDIATVKAQPGSSFLRKWVLLLEAEDPLSGPKGYVKCDLVVCIPGVVPKAIPESGRQDDDDIEGNLLIPEDFSDNGERQPAKYAITIFEAKDLPPKNSGIMASMKKAFVGDAPEELLDPYVQISFAGKSAKTSVKKNSANPKWNEEIIFTEMFPSLVKIIRINVKDDDQSVIATSFLDFTLISDNTMNGFLPTFGPAWINLYGNHRNNNENSPLNSGIGEGLAYRGCLRLSITVQLLDETPKKGVNKAEVRTVPQNQVQLDMAPLESFLLFCTVFDADMIDKKFTGKPARFEIVFGKDIDYSLGKAKDGSLKRKQKIDGTVLVDTQNNFSSTKSVATVSL